MPEAALLCRVQLGAQHTPPQDRGWLAADGSPLIRHSGGPASELQIIAYAKDEGRVYLLYCDADGEELNDWLCESLDEAFEQARAEYGVQPDEWEVQ